MEHLDTLIGFSVIMLIVAQISSFIVEYYLKFRGVRQRDYVKFEAGITHALTKVMVSHALDGAQQHKLQTVLSQVLSANKNIHEDLKGTQINLDIDPLPQELVSVDTTIKQPLALANSLKNAFESVELESTRDFQKHCSFASVASAIMICILFNVNAFQLYESLSTNSAAREVLINSQLLNAQNQLHSSELEQAEVSELGRQIRFANQQLEDLQKYDMEIGYVKEFYPEFSDIPTYAWIGFIVSGLFAGLGAPFWHKVLNRLLGLRQAIAGTSGRSNTPTTINTPMGSSIELEGHSATQAGEATKTLGEIKFGAGNEGDIRIYNIELEAGKLTVDVEYRPPNSEYPQEGIWHKEEFKNKVKLDYEKQFKVEIESVVIRPESLMAIEPLFIAT